MNQRRREISVRMLLGALPGSGGRLLVVGVLLGVLGVEIAGQFIRGMLENVQAFHARVAGATAVRIERWHPCFRKGLWF